MDCNSSDLNPFYLTPVCSKCGVYFIQLSDEELIVTVEAHQGGRQWKDTFRLTQEESRRPKLLASFLSTASRFITHELSGVDWDQVKAA